MNENVGDDIAKYWKRNTYIYGFLGVSTFSAWVGSMFLFHNSVYVFSSKSKLGELNMANVFSRGVTENGHLTNEKIVDKGIFKISPLIQSLTPRKHAVLGFFLPFRFANSLLRKSNAERVSKQPSNKKRMFLYLLFTIISSTAEYSIERVVQKKLFENDAPNNDEERGEYEKKFWFGVAMKCLGSFVFDGVYHSTHNLCMKVLRIQKKEGNLVDTVMNVFGFEKEEGRVVFKGNLEESPKYAQTFLRGSIRCFSSFLAILASYPFKVMCLRNQRSRKIGGNNPFSGLWFEYYDHVMSFIALKLFVIPIAFWNLSIFSLGKTMEARTARFAPTDESDSSSEN